MTGSFLSAWILFPLLLAVTSTGCGLLVRRSAAGELSTLLVMPVGFALVVVICAFATAYGWLAPAAKPAVVVATLAGFALEIRTHSLRRPARGVGPWMWPVLAALIAFAAIGGPVFLTGSVGWTGYTRIVDIAFQFDLAQHLADAGRTMPTSGNSSYNIVTAKLVRIGYPGGAQATLGSLAGLIGTNVAWCYQCFLAFVAAMGALAIFSTLGRITRSGLMRCGGAAVAIQPNILYGYALEAGIKELTTASLLMLVVALFADRLPGDGGRRGMLPAAVAVSAAFAAFSLGIAPWLGLLLVGVFAVSLIRGSGRRRSILGSLTLFAAVAIVISLPGLIIAAKLAAVAGAAIGGVVDLGLGNLAAPVSRWASAGVWITGDYRYPVAHAGTSHVLDTIVICLAVVGALAALLRRRWVIVILGLTAPVALYYFVQHSTAWIQLKSFTITAVFAVTLAFAGAAALQASASRWLRPIGWLAGLIVAAGVLYGNALIYHDTSLAPGARYHDLASIAKRYDGQGPALDPFFDEYAEYFLRGEQASTVVDPANLSFEILPSVHPPPGQTIFGWDLNQLLPRYLQSFSLIVLPRNPTASRPPSNYDLLERTRYFDVWRRNRPAHTVIDHLPLSSLPHERTRAYCSAFLAHVRKTGPSAEVAYAQSSVAAVANPVSGTHPHYWTPLGPGTLATKGAGTLEVTVKLPRAARYDIWLQGSIGRPLAAFLDGRRLSRIGYEERYPSQFLFLSRSTLEAGTHTLRLVRSDGDLHPGSGDPPPETVGRTLGAIVFSVEGADTDRVHLAPASQAAQMCAAPVGYQWMEILRPGAAPPDALPAKL